MIKVVVALGIVGTLFGYEKQVSKWYCLLWQISLLGWVLKLA